MRRRSCNWSTLQGVKRIDATFQGKLIPIYALVLFLSYFTQLYLGITISLNLLTRIMQVDLVCHGTANVANDEDGSDPYEEPKRQGKFEVVPSGNELTTEGLVQRIVAKRLQYEVRNEKKEKKEMAAYKAWEQSKAEQAA